MPLLLITGGLIALFSLASACGGLELRLHNASVQKPSNVALYYSVQTCRGQPVAGLTAESFHIYEDDQLISPFESKQTILNPEIAVVHYIILLLDLSGSITESGSLPTLVDASISFAERVARTHRVAVYGFDGGPKLIPLVRFTTNPKAVRGGLKRLTHRKVKDPSTNLNGAVVEASEVLELRMAKSSQPLRFGTLVVFTDGTDRAHRVSEYDMHRVLDEAGLNVFVIGLGAEIAEDRLARLGRTGFMKASAMASLGSVFDRVAAQIEAAGRKFYLLSYCSPSRAGLHSLRVEAHAENLSGSIEHQFNAEGFGPKCNPKQKPNFPVGRIKIK
jgi:hypothetical protein